MFRPFTIVKRLFSDDVICKMECCCIVPDLLCSAPCQKICITYPKQFVELGNEIAPADVKTKPSLKWCSTPNSFYTLFLLDIDSPSRKDPAGRSWLHWLVCNISCNDIAKGQLIAGYIGALPAKNTDLHRLVFLVYQQCGQVQYCDPIIPDTCANGRKNFVLNCFVEKYKLGLPFAGNFFTTQWDCYVEYMNKKLGISC